MRALLCIHTKLQHLPTLTHSTHTKHIVCCCHRSIKYLYKYVHKGTDRAVVLLHLGEDTAEPVDEIKLHLEGRYVSSCESCWRLLGFTMHHNSPNVVRLTLHMEDEQMLMVPQQVGLQLLIAQGPPSTQLTQFFELNKERVAAHEAAQQLAGLQGGQQLPPLTPLLYQDVPGAYRWHEKRWQARVVKRGTCTVGRVQPAYPKDEELFCLRLLLNHVPNPTCFADLRMWDGQVRATYAEAAEVRGLRQEDSEWHGHLLEHHQLGHLAPSLRMELATLLLNCELTNPRKLWDDHKDILSEDKARMITGGTDRVLTDTEAQLCYDHALRHLENLLHCEGKTLAKFGLPIPSAAPPVPGPRVHVDHIAGAAEQQRLRDKVEGWLGQVNAEQKEVYDKVMKSIEESKQGRHGHRTFFVNAAGGTGKTFTFNLLLAKVRSEGGIALAVSSSGVAALLLDQGCTGHSRFGVPIDLDCTSTCTIKKNSEQADLIRKADLIVWDEAPLMHKHCYEAVNRTLKDIVDRGSRNYVMGGKVFVMGGDFRQLTPVIPGGDRATVVQASLRRSRSLWPHMKQLHLRTNMRVQQLLAEGRDVTQQLAWAKYLLDIGDGKVEDPAQPGRVTGTVQIPPECCCDTENVEDLITHIYGDLTVERPPTMAEDMIKQGILSTTNEATDHINNLATQRLPTAERVYLSADYMTDPTSEDATMYDPEFLNTLEFSGMPSHTLRLKVGMPIILLRNMNASRGMMNGTRLVVEAFRKHSIQARILTGTCKNTSVIIPRIPMAPTDSRNPFKFTRRQLPIRPAWAMTINKAQGQTFKRVAVYLADPCFSHGQLYVAMSRVGEPAGLKFMVVNGRDAAGRVCTDNVVYHELLED